MNITPLQADFSAGEISPLMINRTALEGHSKAADTMENCVALSQGPFKNRDPFEYTAEITGHNDGLVKTLLHQGHRACGVEQVIVGRVIELHIV